MATCPRCKEDMPVLSKICPLCGYVEEGGDDNVTVDGFVTTLEGKLHEIKQTPHPSFGRSFETLTLIIFPLFAVAFLMTAIFADAGLGWIFFGIFALLSARAFIRKAKGKIGNAAVNKKFDRLKGEYEYNARLAKRKFGESREVSGLLDEISGEIKTIEKERKGIAAKNIITWVILVAVVGGLVTWGVMAGTKHAKDPEVVSVRTANKMEKLIEDYRSSGPDAAGAEQKRIDITSEMVKAGEPETAERFFFTDCMGQMKDFDCAKVIVDYYNKNSLDAEAADFVAKCDGMRYKSDQGKLEKMLTR